MDKYIVKFSGHKVIFADNFDEAKKRVQGELKYIHPNFNMKFDSVTRETEENNG